MLPPVPTLAGAILPPDFNVLTILKSFSKATACGPSGLRIQHLLNATEVPLPSPIGALLRDVVNLLASGKVPVSVSKFLAGGSLTALDKNKPNSLPDIRPIAEEKLYAFWLGSVYVQLQRKRPVNILPHSKWE